MFEIFLDDSRVVLYADQAESECKATVSDRGSEPSRTLATFGKAHIGCSCFQSCSLHLIFSIRSSLSQQ